MKDIRLNPQQTEAISHRDGPMIVLSVAGSGKTMVLTERVIHLIEQGLEPARLLAITFTKKAVLEIQSRLKKRLDGHGDKALVCTFHSLGFRILRAENEATIGFRLVHDGEQEDLIHQAMKYAGLEDDPADILSKVSLARNDLISPADLSGFLAHIEEARRVNKSSLSGKATLMTIHQAKGLEFRCVIVPGLNEEILPHINSVEDLANMEEERRLMYVAMTRAMKADHHLQEKADGAAGHGGVEVFEGAGRRKGEVIGSVSEVKVEGGSLGRVLTNSSRNAERERVAESHPLHAHVR